MRALVLGASGFIGFPAAQALSRAGYFVYGQTRSEEKAKRLAVEEIFPIVCDPSSTSWHHLIPTLDVIIDTLHASDPNTYLTLFHGIESATKSLRPASSPKLSFIFTSGTWPLGNQGYDLILTDTTPVLDPTGTGPKAVELASSTNLDRSRVEQEILKSEILNGIVVRPTLLYGRSGSIFSMMFERFRKEGRVSWLGTPGGKLTTIHQDDLADLYVRTAEKAQVIGGLVFIAANSHSEDTDGFLRRFCEIVRVDGKEGPGGGYEYFEPTNVFEKAITTQQIVRPYLARTLLSWEPKKLGLTDGLELYWNAYLASVDK
ncbi:hypothetical protein D9758_014202 [Tetrapyrgos nigripes]|uniref:NAD-dependent epimerase/dehydratase domain-containing protein n=1 Tax=Tetrapyrgos nigripes TaxID=182062 RepID=A0A8H5CXI8_9AGAR|nr:hypothetical protein D9758_014202 [Tetrapyrgos nigripes]